MGSDLHFSNNPNKLFHDLEKQLEDLKEFFSEEKNKPETSSSQGKTWTVKTYEQSEALKEKIDEVIELIHEFSPEPVKQLPKESPEKIEIIPLEEDEKTEQAAQKILQIQVKEEKTERFSYKTAFKAVVLNRENIKTLIKPLAYKALVFVLGIASVLTHPLGMFSKSNDTFSKRLRFKAKLMQANKYVHDLAKIGQSWAKFRFGEKLLVYSKNIAQKDVLEQKLDEAKVKEYVETLKNGKFQEHYFDIFPSLTLDSNEMIAKEKFNVTKSDGDCCGTSLHFIKCCLQEKTLSEKTLIKLAKAYEEGVPAEAAANQTLYEVLNNRIDASHLNSVLSEIQETRKGHDALFLNCDFDFILMHLSQIRKKIVGVNEVTLTDINMFLEEIKMDEKLDPTMELNLLWIKVILVNGYRVKTNLNEQEKQILDFFRQSLERYNGLETKKHIAALSGLKLERSLTSASKEKKAPKLTEKIGNSFAFSSTEEHLHNFNELPPGSYMLAFDTWFLKEQSHAISYIKTEEGLSYLLDPNYGLIKCDAENPKEDLLKLLYLYPEAPSKSSQSKANYHLEILKFVRNDSLSQTLTSIQAS